MAYGHIHLNYYECFIQTRIKFHYKRDKKGLGRRSPAAFVKVKLHIILSCEQPLLWEGRLSKLLSINIKVSPEGDSKWFGIRLSKPLFILDLEFIPTIPLVSIAAAATVRMTDPVLLKISCVRVLEVDINHLKV